MQLQQQHPAIAHTFDSSPACWLQAPRLTSAGMASEAPLTNGIAADGCDKAPVGHADTSWL